MKSLYDKLKSIEYGTKLRDTSLDYKPIRRKNKVLLKTKDCDDVSFKIKRYYRRNKKTPFYLWEYFFISKFLRKNKDKPWSDVLSKLMFRIKNHKGKFNINYKDFLIILENPYYAHNGHFDFFIDQEGFLRAKEDFLITKNRF